MTDSKKLISKKPSLDFILTSMQKITIEKFFDMFDATPEITTLLIAHLAMREVNSTNRIMNLQELKIQGLN